MTETLYYQDAFLTQFTAHVTGCEAAGEGWWVTLDRTAFYPEGGGQPCDTGTLGGAAVTDVREKGGEIRHLCAAPLAVGDTVEGEIDFARRFDHMQQHSGEHVVSGLLCAAYHCDNVGFHLGKELVTIDFNAAIPPEDLPRIEEQANAYLWQDQAVQVRYLEGEALEQAVYRSKKWIPGVVRLVSFPGADCCACCGTHVRTAGQVGLIKLLSCQKFRDGVRIEMVCGRRCLAYCSAILNQNLQVSHLLSAKTMDTAAAVERTMKELYALRGRVARLEEEAFERKAEALRDRGDVTLLEGPMSPESLRKLCAAVTERCGGRCIVFAGEDASYLYAAALPGEGDLRPLAKEINQQLRGRGGGKPGFVQGSVAADRAAILALFPAAE